MRAAIINRYGGPEQIQIRDDLPEPSVSENQVLVRVCAAGLNPLDIRTRAGDLRWFRGDVLPFTPGNDASGVVVRCGSAVTRFREGDEVYGMFDPGERLSWARFTRSGACSEYAVTREDTLALKPSSLSHEQAAAIPVSCLTAWQVLKDRLVSPGTRVMINGASGGVGVFAVQLAKALGANVTAVCSDRHLAAVASLGADEVIDYRQKDIRTLSQRFDIIYDVAVTTSFCQCAHLLEKDGVFVSNIATPGSVLASGLYPLSSIVGFRKRNTFAFVMPSGQDLRDMAVYFDRGVMRPVIDRVFPLALLPDAHRYLENERGLGKVVIQVSAD
jgi:NADPH:quinone reductase-like Zn-dependent oxidoreductase